MTIGDARLESRTKEDFRIGRVVSHAFAALSANFGRFVPLTLAVMIPYLFISVLTVVAPDITGMNAVSELVPGENLRFLATLLLSVATSFGGTIILQATITHATVLWLSGEMPDMGRSLHVALRNVFPLIGLGILEGLGLGLGILLLVVPGVILLCMWSLAFPARVVEGTGIFESFGRSRNLTRGYRGAIFLLLLIYGLLTIAVFLAARPVLGVPLLHPKASDITVLSAFVMWLGRVVSALLQALLYAALYFEIHRIKEGIGSEQALAAFD